jgi:hypothetical protein
MPQIDYKKKYQELKTKFMNAVDVAWRDGYEQGMKDSQIEQMQQQQQQDEMAAQAAAQGGMPGQEGGMPEDQQAAAEAQEPGVEAPDSEHPDGSELDQHIKKLESMLGKGELPASDVQDLKKTLNEIKLYQGNISLIKSMESVKNTKMRKPVFIAPRASINLNDNAKKALGMQEKIVGDIMKSWEEEERRASKDITSQLNLENIVDNKNG